MLLEHKKRGLSGEIVLAKNPRKDDSYLLLPNREGTSLQLIRRSESDKEERISPEAIVYWVNKNKQVDFPDSSLPISPREILPYIVATLDEYAHQITARAIDHPGDRRS